MGLRRFRSSSTPQESFSKTGTNDVHPNPGVHVLRKDGDTERERDRERYRERYIYREREREVLTQREGEKKKIEGKIGEFSDIDNTEAYERN